MLSWGKKAVRRMPAQYPNAAVAHKRNSPTTANQYFFFLSVSDVCGETTSSFRRSPLHKVSNEISNASLNAINFSISGRASPVSLS